MGIVTLSLGNETEEKFRKAAELNFGSGKGSLGKAATIALEKWADSEIKGNEAKMLELLEKGFEMGKLKYKHREELYER